MKQSLKQRIETIVSELVSDLSFLETAASTPGWAHGSARFLNLCIQAGFISRAKLLDMIDKQIKVVGKANIRINPCPDHILSPAALAYAIKHNALSEQELQSIQYNGDTEAEFVALYDEPNFCGQILDQL